MLSNYIKNECAESCVGQPVHENRNVLPRSAAPSLAAALSQNSV
jgi:hypothetical protein